MMTRSTVTMLALVLTLSIIPAGVADATLYANVIAVSFRQGNPFLRVTVAVLKGIDNASRKGNADFGLRVTVTYLSSGGIVETLDSGRVSISDTAFVGQIDGRTVVVSLDLPLGTTSPPKTNPSYSATAQVVHRDPASVADDALGPDEVSFPQTS